MKNKLIMVAAAAAIVTLGLAGCSASSPASTKKTTLTVVGWKGQGANLADIPTLNKAFEKAYPNIKLDYTYVDDSNYTTYNNPRLAGGDAADVIMVDTPEIRSWGKQGYLANLSGLTAVSEQDSTYKADAGVGGETYAVVSESTPVGLFTNLDLLKKDGINSAPTDWPTFIKDLETLKSDGDGGLVLAQKNLFGGSAIMKLMASNFVASDWAENYDAGNTTFGKSWGQSISELKELFDKGLVDPKLSLGLDENVDAPPQFEAGKWAFMPTGSWELSTLKSATKENIAFIPFPGGAKGSQPKTFVFVGTGWAINAKTKNSAAAKDYINFMSEPKQAEAYLKADSAFSTLKDVKSPNVPEDAAVVKAAADGDMLPSTIDDLNSTGAATAFNTAIENLFINPSLTTSDELKTLNSTVTPTPPTK
ncbi:MAG TPA: extracellular solute-binding protein [Galbitalea sp.]|jgi:raffinose/stachyose/melibiose transport system substrate-binding protein|nr:extracellular solute-binding protein [Galbitalea sp.]